jgi:cyclopropane fatty-acyl-phospholipid synthase-like methyltransferase
MNNLQTKELIRFLKNSDRVSLKAFDRLKQVYRPMICPFDTLLNLIPEGEHVLEIGCGIGTFLFLLNEYRQPASLGGLETDPASIETARAVLKQMSSQGSVRLLTYNGITLPKWIREYNYVVLIDVLHHIPSEQHVTFLAGLFDHMHPGALLILKDIDADRRFLCLFNKVHDFLLTGARTYERRLSNLREALQNLGFQIQRVMTQRVYVYPHFTVVCKR